MNLKLSSKFQSKLTTRKCYSEKQINQNKTKTPKYKTKI